MGESGKSKVSRVTRIIQLALGLAGLAGATLHAFPLQVHERHQNWPNVDLTALAWLGLIAFAIWLPDISEISWGTFSVKKEKFREASDLYKVSLDNLANLVQNWSTSAAMYVDAMSQSDDTLPEPKGKIYNDYIRDRMGEAYEMLATKSDETVRLGLWLYNPSQREILFITGFRMKPKRLAYKPGEGMIGKAFVENRHFNEANIANVPSYMSSRDSEDPPYSAVLCEPVRWHNQPLGMITVDRSTVGNFDYVSEQVTQGLASQCALAVKVFEAG